MTVREIRFTGGASTHDLFATMKRTGVRRGEAIRLAVADSYRDLLRKYPDLPRPMITVDVLDMTGAAAVTWVFHLGDRRPSTLAEPYTTTHTAEDWLRNN